jgi:flagellar biosynthetic protein FliR
MQSSLVIPAQTLTAFLLVMARMGGMMMFVPMPGLRSGPALPRVLLAVASAFLLFPYWPRSGDVTDPARFAGAMLAEAGFGVAVGLLVACLAETLVMGAQIVSLQAGYSYASTIDPTTEAEASYLLVIAQLLGGVLLFALGIDRQVLLVLARSLDTMPPGTFALSPGMADSLGRFASVIFSTGLRLVLPVVALLAMTDIALALLGRLNTQLQVISLAFPVKMLACLGLLAWTAALYPRVLGDLAQRTVEAAFRLVR